MLQARLCIGYESLEKCECVNAARLEIELLEHQLKVGNSM